MDDRTTQPTLQILLVDDSVADRGTFSRLLRRVEGRRYNIAEAETVEAGLECYRLAPPDCVVLDYRLPDESGLYFLQQLAEAGEQAPFPVVMVTGSGDERVADVVLDRVRRVHPPKERGPIREAWNSATSTLYLRHHVRVADGSLLAFNHLAAQILYHERPAHQVLVSLGPLPMANQSGNGSTVMPEALDLTAVGG